MADERPINDVLVYRDSAGFYRERPNDAPVVALKAQLDAATATIPQPATTMPMAEKTGAAVGSSPDKFARADHQHPRLTSTTLATLGSNGQATVAFTRAFANKPGINPTEIDATASSQPLVLRAIGWTQDANGAYTGVIIQGSRAQLLPELTPLSGVLTLLGQVITGVNAVTTALTKYNLFGGSAAGASISVIAVARSDVPAT
jgi:hypothetical protein